MIAIADNLNTRNTPYMDAVLKRDRKTMTELIKNLSASGADMINVQCSLDGAGDEDTLPWVTGLIAEAGESGVSLDSRNTQAIKKTLPLCKKPPLVNFISKTEPQEKNMLLHLVADSESSLVIRASSNTIPASIEAKLQIIEELIEMANEADIPNERLFADPSIVHLGRGTGQKHLVNSHECILVINELVEPPLNTIAWISNISTGLPKTLRKPLEATFLSYLAGAGLDAAMVDILDENVQRAIYLAKAFRDEIVFSQADIA
jgi:5-methyltetrahydrofolate corrinoid/iron sulfur protein methyltransferase